MSNAPDHSFELLGHRFFFGEPPPTHAQAIQEWQKQYSGMAEAEAAIAQYNSGNLEEALHQLTRLVVFQPDFFSLYILKAVVEVNLGKIEDARKSLNWVLVKDPTSTQARQLLEQLG